ncbi:hypothetical protein AWB80_01229 [Caballeronia pedi]|uniref:Uncharacterized protein n=1 Tax=Caballeronia pedi TaxID=1777141 RepID=A0A157ZUA0_9BURK|nr:hypothetical protein [Caballeronia pedi]SAK48497.1 hypothetical protein AWB80_01229 [Caballeronia pedi]
MTSSHIHLPFISALDAATVVTKSASANANKYLSPYSSLLQAPMSSLANNAHDRADVSFSAILGYN